MKSIALISLTVLGRLLSMAMRMLEIRMLITAAIAITTMASRWRSQVVQIECDS